MGDAGWYKDPTTRHHRRYFDGDKWTSKVSDDGIESNDADLSMPPIVGVPPAHQSTGAMGWWHDISAGTKVVVVVIGIAIGLGILGALAGGSSDDEDAGDYGAYTVCEDAIYEQLKAPSTAEFSGYTDSTITPDGPDAWIVVGYVDAENSFGATLRRTFTCDVERDGDLYTAVSADLIE